VAQLALDFDRRPPHNGSPTSRAAAESMVPHVRGQKARVLAAIVAAGERGCTGDEIEVATGVSHQAVGPRLLELRSAGLVRRAIDDQYRTIERPTRTGRMAVVWVATERRP